MFKRFSVFVHSLVQTHQARRNPEIGLLKAENRMFRERLSTDYIIPKDSERRELLAWGAKLNHEVDGLLTAVSIETYKRWRREEAKGKLPGQVGRKLTDGEAKNWVLKMKKANPSWGYLRIAGELEKIGITLAKSTVKRILEREFPSEPPDCDDHTTRKRLSVSWDQFFLMHADSMLGCDFIKQKVHSLRHIVL